MGVFRGKGSGSSLSRSCLDLGGKGIPNGKDIPNGKGGKRRTLKGFEVTSYKRCDVVGFFSLKIEMHRCSYKDHEKPTTRSYAVSV